MRGLPILTFHEIGNGSSALEFPPEVFSRGLERLHERGWETVDLASGVERLRRGEDEPSRSFVITFDDGYAGVYRHALPTLRSLGMSATVFVTTGERKAGSPSSRLPMLEGRTMLSWSELAEMAEAGFSIGAHTLTHPDLTRLSYERASHEMKESRDRLADKLGVAVRSFAYPYGAYHHGVRAIAEELFDVACSDRLGWASTGSDLFALERIETYYLRRQKQFDLLASPSIHGYLALRNGPRTLRRLAGSLRRRARFEMPAA